LEGGQRRGEDLLIRKLGVVGAVIALLGLALSIVSPAVSDVRYEKVEFTLTDKSSDDADNNFDVDVGDEGFGVGDYFVIGSDPLYNRAGNKQVGHTNGDCLLTELDEATFEVTFECDVTFVLRKGSITAEGPFSGTETSGSGNLAVTGGTGRYRTAHGEVHVTETDTGLSAQFGLLL
jgi:hypothetical protein